MRFWLVPSEDVSIQNQIVAQVSLGILSGELAPGERLPSIRALARRFHIHANTVSLAYRRLEREHWLEVRQGSGIFVRNPSPAEADARQPQSPTLDALLRRLIEEARTLGVSPLALRQRLEIAWSASAPASFLLIEPDPHLARIVLAELTSTLTLPISTTDFSSQHPAVTLPVPPGAHALVLPSKAEAVRAALPTATPLHTLSIRSIPQTLGAWMPAPVNALVGIVSHWEPFLEFARTMLIAAGFDAEALLLRNANEPAWRDGLEQTDGVVCDCFAASLMPAGLRLISFSLLADDTLTQLRHLEDPSRTKETIS